MTKIPKLYCTLLVAFLCIKRAADSNAQIITTIVGSGTYSYSGDGGAATAATLRYPMHLDIDSNGSIYIADHINYCIRKIAASGTITTVAGNGLLGFTGDGGAATSAKLNSPTSVKADRFGNLYISDMLNNRIRKVSPSGIISTVAGTGTAGYSGDGGAATSAQLNEPGDVCLDTAGNLYIAELTNNVVRRISPAGVISTFAGTGTAGYSGDGGPATAARLKHPFGITIDRLGNMYIADHWNNVIRKITPAGIISTYAGGGTSGLGDGGPATAGLLFGPNSVAVDKRGNLFIADQSHHLARMVSQSGIITSIAGSGIAGFSGDGGPATAAMLNVPFGVCTDDSESIYISEAYNNRIRKIVCFAPPYAGTIAGVDSLCPGVNTTLSSFAGGGTWSNSNLSVTTVSGAGIVTGISAGTDTIKYIVTSTCGSDTAIHIIYVRSHAACHAATNITANRAINSLTLSPNPTHGEFIISLTSHTSSEAHIFITNVLGQQVQELTISTNKATEVQMNAPAGVYYLTATVGCDRMSGTIVLD